MKVKILITFFLASPFGGLHAADNNIGAAESDPAIVQEGEIIPEGIEGTVAGTLTEANDETLTETIDETANSSSDENFVPSIRITEDLPVAFPIDI